MGQSVSPRIVRETALAIANGATSDIFDMGAIDLFYIKPTGGNVEAVFFPPSIETNVFSGEQSEPLTCVSGEALSLDNGEMSAWGAVQLRNNSGGAVTVDLILNCRGRS